LTDDVDTKLQLLKGGPKPSKPPSRRRRVSKKESVKPPIKDPTPTKIEVYEDIPVEDVKENILFKPNPGPQTAFLSATETEVLYGGAAGGEPKSWFYCLLSRVI
jgi:hypothetical protein